MSNPNQQVKPFSRRGDKVMTSLKKRDLQVKCDDLWWELAVLQAKLNEVHEEFLEEEQERGTKQQEDIAP